MKGYQKPFGLRKVLTLLSVTLATMMFAPAQAGRFSEILNSNQTKDQKKIEKTMAADKHPLIGDVMEQPTHLS